MHRLDFPPSNKITALRWVPTFGSTHLLLQLEDQVQGFRGHRLAITSLQSITGANNSSPHHIYAPGSFMQLAPCLSASVLVCQWPDKVGVLDATTGFMLTPVREVHHATMDLTCISPDGSLLPVEMRCSERKAVRHSQYAEYTIPEGCLQHQRA